MVSFFFKSCVSVFGTDGVLQDVSRNVFVGRRSSMVRARHGGIRRVIHVQATTRRNILHVVSFWWSCCYEFEGLG